MADRVTHVEAAILAGEFAGVPLDDWLVLEAADRLDWQPLIEIWRQRFATL